MPNNTSKRLAAAQAGYRIAEVEVQYKEVESSIFQQSQAITVRVSGKQADARDLLDTSSPSLHPVMAIRWC